MHKDHIGPKEAAAKVLLGYGTLSFRRSNDLEMTLRRSSDRLYGHLLVSRELCS